MRRPSIDPYFVVGLLSALVLGGVYLKRTQKRANIAPPSPQHLEASLLDTLSLYGVHTSRGIAGTIEVVEITDLQCPACALAQQALAPILESWAQEERIHHTVIDAPLLSHVAAIPATVAAACVQQRSPQHLSAFRASVYERQNEWTDAYPVEPLLLQIADGVGIDTTAVGECMAHEGSDRATRHRLARGILSEAGFDYVPVFSVNGMVIPWSQLETILTEAVGNRSARTGQ